MNRDSVSNSYAVSLLSLAESRSEHESLQEEVEGILELLRGDDEFKTFILVPSIDAREKTGVLDRVLKGKISDTLLDFLDLVIVKNRQDRLEAILEEFLRLLDEKLGRVHAEVTSAVALGEEAEKSLSTTLGEKLGKSVLLHSRVDPDILGGLVIRFGDLVIDGSVRTQLKKISSRLTDVKLGSELVHEN